MSVYRDKIGEIDEVFVAEWYFEKQSRGRPRINPAEQMLFKDDQTQTEEYSGTDQLVREIIQNSLDAAQDDHSEVSVRLAVYSAADMPSGERQLFYFNGLKEAAAAKDKTIEFDGPIPKTDLGFFVCEDFETRGLEGDPRRDTDPADTESREDFYWFWRNIGRSGKTREALGRWGLGKTVYRAVGRAGAMLGLTIRQSDHHAYLMGQAVTALHTRYIEGKRVESVAEGYWGNKEQDGFMNPIEDKETITQFKKDWKLIRDGEPGLSVVVPFVSPILSADTMTKCVIVNFFVPIIQKKLKVTIQCGSYMKVIDSITIGSVCSELNWQGGSKNFKRDEAPPIDFVREALQMQKKAVLSRSLKAAFEKEESFSSDELETLKTDFNSGKMTAAVKPIEIQKRRGETERGQLFIFLKKNQESGAFHCYAVRGGMTITKINSPKCKKGGVRALILVEKEDPLSSLLADTENANHENWDTSNERAEEIWSRGWKNKVGFCRNSADELYDLLNIDVGKRDYRFFEKIFSVPVKKGARQIGGGKEPGGETREIRTENSSWFLIEKVKRGFRIKRNADQPIPPNARLRVTVAYDFPAGNPFKKWSRFDFDFMEETRQKKKLWKGHGLFPKAVHGNVIEIVNFKENFSIERRDFDVTRDLRVLAEDITAEAEQNG